MLPLPGRLAVEAGLQGGCLGVVAAHPLQGLLHDETRVAAPHDEVVELAGGGDEVDFQPRLVERVDGNPPVLVAHVGEEELPGMEGTPDLDGKGPFAVGHCPDARARHDDVHELQPLAGMLVAHQPFDGDVTRAVGACLRLRLPGGEGSEEERQGIKE